MSVSILDLGERSIAFSLFRLGWIKLGEKPQGEWARATKNFNLPPELEKYYGTQCNQITVYLPSNNREDFFPQQWEREVKSQGGGAMHTVCCGSGGGAEGRELQSDQTWLARTCEGKNCERANAQKGRCRKVGVLVVYVPIPGQPLDGVWHIKTGNSKSLRMINAQIKAFKYQLRDKIAMVPMFLRIMDAQKVRDGKGKTRTVYPLSLALALTPKELTRYQEINYSNPLISDIVYQMLDENSQNHQKALPETNKPTTPDPQSDGKKEKKQQLSEQELKVVEELKKRAIRAMTEIMNLEPEKGAKMVKILMDGYDSFDKMAEDGGVKAVTQSLSDLVNEANRLKRIATG